MVHGFRRSFARGKIIISMLKKIVIIGPESTGKSTLCAQLAAHYNTIWVEEYAREYLLTNGREYTFGNLLDVASGQIENEEAGVKSIQKHAGTPPNLLFIDTDMYVLKVWCEFVFNRCPPLDPKQDSGTKVRPVPALRC